MIENLSVKYEVLDWFDTFYCNPRGWRALSGPKINESNLDMYFALQVSK